MSDARGDYRRDIDGLRAIAVAAVVLFHAVGAWLPAGFVGVDVFFVISGYLIGGIVYAGAQQRQFSFAGFYARRARRILPALFAVVAFFSAVALLVFDSREAGEYGGQAAAALAGVSNLYFWKHVGYFATAADQQPLLMTWSLGVEEQFYLFFPVLMLVIARLRARYRLAAVLGLTAVSLATSLALTTRAPGSAFYLLPPRAWELGVGAALAMIHRDAPHTQSVGSRSREIAAVAAMAGLVASFFLFDATTPFPGWAALLPVLTTAALIQTRGSRVNQTILGSRPLVGTGLVSYSWYLWHWPLMALVRRVADGEPTVPQMLAVALLGLGCGVASWRWIEQPFRRASRPNKQTLRRYAVALIAALAVPAALYWTNGLPQRLPLGAQVLSRQVAETGPDCLAPYGSGELLREPRCYPPGASVALIGDSHAAALAPGLVASAAQMGAGVAQYTMSSCTPLLGFAPLIASEPHHPAQCARFRQSAMARIVADPAMRVIVVAGFWNNLDRLRLVHVADGTTVPTDRAVREGLATLTTAAATAGKHVLLVADVPSPGFSLPNRMLGEAIPVRRLLRRLLAQSQTVQGSFANEAQPTVTSAASLASKAGRLHAEFFDPATQLCPKNRCVYRAGAAPAFVDAHHLSPAGSRQLDWRAALTEAGTPTG